MQTDKQNQKNRNSDAEEKELKLTTSTQEDSQKNVNEFNEAVEEADKQRTKKPGSQSNSGDRHNNGRGGGK